MESRYKTRDLAEASFLLTNNLPLVDIQREGKICWFIFDNKEECEKLKNDYWFRNAPVPAKTFFESIQTLKNRIFSIT